MSFIIALILGGIIGIVAAIISKSSSNSSNSGSTVHDEQIGGAWFGGSTSDTGRYFR